MSREADDVRFCCVISHPGCYSLSFECWIALGCWICGITTLFTISLLCCFFLWGSLPNLCFQVRCLKPIPPVVCDDGMHSCRRALAGLTAGVYCLMHRPQPVKLSGGRWWIWNARTHKQLIWCGCGLRAFELAGFVSLAICLASLIICVCSLRLLGL